VDRLAHRNRRHALDVGCDAKESQQKKWKPTPLESDPTLRGFREYHGENSVENVREKRRPVSSNAGNQGGHQADVANHGQTVAEWAAAVKGESAPGPEHFALADVWM